MLDEIQEIATLIVPPTPKYKKETHDRNSQETKT